MFYQSREWGKTKLMFYSLDPNNRLCKMCLMEDRVEVAKSVDHIVTLWLDYGKRFDLDNPQGFCDHHYSIKSKQENEMKNDIDIKRNMNFLERI